MPDGIRIESFIAGRVLRGLISASAITFALSGFLFATSPATAAPSGSLSGTVTDAATHAAVANECVSAYDASGGSVGFGQTDSAGHYTVSGLASGSYKVGFQSCAGGSYQPQFYNNKGSLATADPVSVTAGSTTTGIDAALQPGGKITGTVTDAATHAAVASECVSAYDASGGSVGFGQTDSAGHYTVSGLASGSYKVGFRACLGGNYLPQFYNNKGSLATADPVSVTAGSTTTGIDAALQPGGKITGTVTDAATHAAVTTACVSASDASNNSVGFGQTDSTGHYSISALASGSYKVGFQSCLGGNYLPQFYNNKGSLATADPVSVTAGSTTTGIDAALQPGGQITGTVIDAATHAAVANACVNVYDTSNSFVGSGTTDSAGHYTISALASGSYKVGFQSCAAGSYQPQFYNNKGSLATADPVSVTAGSTTTGIDAALQPGGQITGTVIDAATHAAVANECVSVSDASNNSVGFGQTDSAGHYTISALASGSYKVGFQSCSGGSYPPQFYNNKGSLATADPVSVTAGSTTTGIDAALQPGGKITGTVTDAATLAAVANECVSAYDANGGSVGFGQTDSAGHYTISALAAGSYKVSFYGCSGGNYAPQFYNNKGSLATADPVSVTAGSTTTGIDAALQAPGQITGTVTDAATHAAVANECVSAYDANGGSVGFGQTDSAGRYTVSGLAAGSYKVSFYGCSGGNYAPQFYNNKGSLATADPVSVTAGSTTTGIDAALQAPGQITGTVTDAGTNAAISGACVGAFDAGNNLLTFAFTDSAGGYTLSGLATGSYKVGFASDGGVCPTGPPNYTSQYYNNKPSFAAADLVSVTAGSTTSGIDAALVSSVMSTLTVSIAGSGLGTVTGSGIDCPGTCSLDYPSGTSVTLSATATAGSTFTGWSGGGCSGTGTCTMTMSSDHTVTATFTITHTLAVSIAGSGSGTVTGSGIDCPGTCSLDYPSGTSVTLSATATAGSTFTGWSGGGCSGTGTCTMTMSSDHTVTATFTITHTLAVSIAGSGSGTVTGSGIDCPGTCSLDYPSGTSVTLSATATAGSTFTGWSGGGCSGTGTCTMTMSSDHTVTATFTIVPTVPGKPTATILTPADGASYVQDQVLAAAYSCEAAQGATLSSCAGPVANGQPIDTHTVGPHTFTVTATDNLGSTTSRSVSYKVIGKPGGGVLPPPVLSKVSQSAKRWREDDKLPQISAANRPPVGTTLSFTLNIPAKVSFAFAQQTTGRKVGKNCVAQTNVNRKKPRCTMTVTVATLTFNAHPGANTVRFAGRISPTKKLRPGTYTVQLTATNANGKLSKTAALSFTIVK